MDLALAALVFGVIFLAELPDKSLFASLILGTKFNGWYVWLGAAAAFLVHVVIAVTAGQILTILPHRIVESIVALLFLGGAALLFFGKHGLEEEPTPHDVKGAPTAWKIFATSFGIVFIGEWGDITQITTANYAARYHNPLSVGIGALLGLWAVTGLAIVAGKHILNRIPVKLLQRITAIILLIFGLFSAYSALR